MPIVHHHPHSLPHKLTFQSAKPKRSLVAFRTQVHRTAQTRSIYFASRSDTHSIPPSGHIVGILPGQLSANKKRKLSSKGEIKLTILLLPIYHTMKSFLFPSQPASQLRKGPMYQPNLLLVVVKDGNSFNYRFLGQGIERKEQA